MALADLNIVLHAHLPYVHHPEYEDFLEEAWLFEAITDCYLPLLAMLDRLQADGVAYRLTLSLSPTLIILLQSDLLQQRYWHYLLIRQQLIEAEIRRTLGQPEVQCVALHYRQQLQQCSQQYHACTGDLLAQFKHHQQSGGLCLITTAATHGFLPLLRQNAWAVRNQVRIGLDTFQQAFGFKPEGFWLPECGFYAGLEQVLVECGVRYFFVDSHALEGADEKPLKGVYAPVDCGNGVAAFARDPLCSRQVWSADEGYPGDADYREFHRDMGYELAPGYLAKFFPKDRIPSHIGLKYHRITGNTEAKQWYDPERAMQKAQQHAEDFLRQRQQHITLLSRQLGQAPIMVAPFDAELFGHWWYEGPLWLEQVLRLAASGKYALQLQSGEDYLATHDTLQTLRPADSSWGHQGAYRYWINDSNDWIYPCLHQAADDMEKLIQDLKAVHLSDVQERAVNQALRSLLLAQASDWSFMLTAGTTREYANKQLEDHLARFNYLMDGLQKNRLDARYVAALEIMDDIFPTLDFRQYE